LCTRRGRAPDARVFYYDDVGGATSRIGSGVP